MYPPRNQIITDEFHKSRNFYKSDLILLNYLQTHLSKDAYQYMIPLLNDLGRNAAVAMDTLSLTADKNTPLLKKRDPYGKTVNKVEFHPAYGQLIEIAARSEMFYVKYEPTHRKKYGSERNMMGYATGQIYAMSELGVYCPLCMTDGAAHLIDRYAPDDIKYRLLPRLYARKGKDLFTGAMFLTEKSGGSDVGRNLTTATPVSANTYQLKGEKWFCSNVNADVIMALARTGSVVTRTRGLSLFLVEKILPDGSRNPMDIIRLKDKMGVRSMATGEVIFENTTGIRLGQENDGFKLMAEMINISRTYNAVAAIGAMRRALVEVWEYLNHRIIFGKKAVEHALIRQKFHELTSKYLAEFLLIWRAIRATDASEKGNEEEQHLARILIPMAKWRSADQVVYIVRECMELMGGNGYIEDFVLPKILRDVNVLPIWEGSGNIIVLDILRATRKTEGVELMSGQIKRSAVKSEKYARLLNRNLDACINTWLRLEQESSHDIVAATVKPLFQHWVHLYQMALMIEERDEQNRVWIDPALTYMASVMDKNVDMVTPPTLDTVRGQMAWNY